jgi:hypothetical protein
MQYKFLLPFIGFSSLFLSACCDTNIPQEIIIQIDSLPNQEYITVYGVKNGKALEKKQLSYEKNMQSPYYTASVFYFTPSVDVSSKQSTFVIVYQNKQKVTVQDTVTVDYTVGVEYKQGCGAYFRLSQLKVTKNTSKSPHIIQIQ